MGSESILRLCIFTNHFFPEEFKVNDIAFELAERGHEVVVITAIPDYPQKRMFRKYYSLFKKRREILNGVTVIRLPIIPRYKGSAVLLFLNYLSYFFSSYVFTYLHSFFHRYDAIFVHETSPFFIGLAAVHLKQRQHIPLVFWTLDLWSESLSAVTHIYNRVLLAPFELMVKHVYNNCDKILIGSQGFEHSICAKGGYKEKCIYFPNWAENTEHISQNPINISETYPFSEFAKDDFVFLFAGNLGAAQNLTFILDAANEVRYLKQIRFVFIGDGRCRNDILEFIKKKNLEETVFAPGRFPISTMPLFMQRANVLMVSLKDDPIFNLTVPAKVQFYMAHGKPILAMLNGDAAKLIEEAMCGVSVPVNNLANLIQAIRHYSTMTEKELTKMGENGKMYYEQKFKKNLRIDQLERLFFELLAH